MLRVQGPLHLVLRRAARSGRTLSWWALESTVKQSQTCGNDQKCSSFRRVPAGQQALKFAQRPTPKDELTGYTEPLLHGGGTGHGWPRVKHVMVRQGDYLGIRREPERLPLPLQPTGRRNFAASGQATRQRRRHLQTNVVLTCWRRPALLCQMRRSA
jgi:hypothetical protein